MTLLSDYLQSAGLTASELARQLNTSRGYVHDLANGRRSPSMRMAGKIARVTENAIPVSAWEEVAPKTDQVTP